MKNQTRVLAMAAALLVFFGVTGVITGSGGSRQKQIAPEYLHVEVLANGQAGVVMVFPSGATRGDLFDRLDLENNTGSNIRLGNGSKIIITASGAQEGDFKFRVERMNPATLLALGKKLDINSVSTFDLTLLPGIGPSRAARITAFRQRKGRLERLSSLIEIKGIGKKTVESLRPYFKNEF